MSRATIITFDGASENWIEFVVQFHETVHHQWYSHCKPEETLPVSTCRK